MTRSRRSWTEPEYGLTVKHEVSTEPVSFYLLGEQIVAKRHIRVTCATEGDSTALDRYAGHIAFASAELRPSASEPVHIRETWAVLEQEEGPAVVLYALYEAAGGEVAGGLCIEHSWGVGRYDAPRWLPGALADLGAGAQYSDLRAATLCDVMHQTVVHHETRTEVHERPEGDEVVAPLSILWAPELADSATTFVSAAVCWGVMAPELATMLSLRKFEGAAYGWRSAELDSSTRDTHDTGTLRLALDTRLLGHQARLVVELVEDGLDRDGISDASARALEMLTLPESAEREEPAKLGRLLSAVYLCDPTQELDATLLAREPGMPLSGTVSRGIVAPPLVDLAWARMLLLG